MTRLPQRPAFRTLHMILLAVLFLLVPGLGQSEQENTVSGSRAYQRMADERAQVRDFRGAIDYYDKAIAVEPSESQRERLQRDLRKVKRQFYIELAEKTRQTSSREETLGILIEARRLEVDQESEENLLRKLSGFLGGNKNFDRAVKTIEGLQQEIFAELGKEAEAAAARKEYAEAVSKYQQAAELAPQLFQSAGMDVNLSEVKDRQDRFSQLTADANRLLDQKQYEPAREMLNQADKLYPGQEAVEVALGKINRVEKNYQQVKLEGDKAYERGDLDEAVGKYQQAQSLHPQFAARDNLAARMTQARDGLAVDKSLLTIRESYQKGRFDEVREECDKLLTRFPGHEEAVSYRAKAVSQLLSLEAEQHVKALRYQKAEEALAKAVESDPANEEASQRLQNSRRYRRTSASGRLLFHQGRCEESRRQLLQARELDRQRFRMDGLETLLSEDCGEKTESTDVAGLEEGLNALLSGKPERSIQILETLLRDGTTEETQVRAFLGAAYSYEAFLQNELDETTLEKAREQFRIALSLAPEFQLSPRLFSPKVVALFEQVRNEQK